MDANEVLETKGYLSRIRQWPAVPEEANPARWLSGFAPEHQDHALALLDAFVFISDKQTKKLFSSVVHSLSAEIASAEPTYLAKRDKWRSFLSSAMISAPTGEEPNPSDSGYIFQRLARTALRLEEQQLLHVTEIRREVENHGPRPLILVDDFIGSGNQFLVTWHRNMWPSPPHSLAELTAVHGLTVYYLPLVCTSLAAQRLGSDAPEVLLRPCHVLTDVYAAGNPESIVFPSELRPSAAVFIQEASQHAGIISHPRGFWNLELALGFEHSIPDANLGVIWSEEGGWFPLIAKP